MTSIKVIGDPSDVIAMFTEHHAAATKVLLMLAKLDPEYEHGIFGIIVEMTSLKGIAIATKFAEMTGAVTHLLHGGSPALVGVVPRSPLGAPGMFGPTLTGMAIADLLNIPRQRTRIPLIVISPLGTGLGEVVFTPL